MKYPVIILMLLFVNGIYGAGLSLKDCYHLTIQNNAQVNLQSERLLENSAKIAEAKGQQLPSATVSGSVMHNGDVVTTKFGATSFQMMPDNSIRALLQVNQTLFDGYRIQNNIRLQTANKERTVRDKMKIEQDLAYAVSSAYWGWVLAFAVERVARDAKENAAENARTAQLRYNAGQISRYDLLRSQVQREQFATNWESARANCIRSTQALEYITSTKITEEMYPSDTLNATLLDFSLDSLYKSATQFRVEFTQLELQRTSTGLGIKLAQTGYYPMLLGTGNVSWVNGSDPFHPDVLQRSWQVGVQLSYPLFDGWQTRQRVEQSRSLVKQTDWLSKDLERGIRNEIRQAAISYRDAVNRRLLQDQYVLQAEEACKLAHEQFANGQMSSRDVADAELSLSNARTSREQAKYDLTMAVASIKKATGQLRIELSEGVAK